jgi:hypothetical protein
VTTGAVRPPGVAPQAQEAARARLDRYGSQGEIPRYLIYQAMSERGRVVAVKTLLPERAVEGRRASEATS